MRALHCVSAAAFIFGSSMVAPAATVHVPSDEPTIQAGIDAASYGDTVIVASGTYFEHDIMMKSGVCLRSETGLADCVTIDAEQHEFWAWVIACVDADPSTVIEGFTLTGGYHALGGATWFHDSYVTLRNIVITGSFADAGAGIYCVGSSLVLESVELTDNLANLQGGGISAGGSSLLLEGCALRRNTAGGSEDSHGGGLYCASSDVTVSDCVFSANSANPDGGGAFCKGSTTNATRCVFSANVGGGMVCQEGIEGSFCSAEACTFSGNFGAGLNCEGLDQLTATNCVFLDNANAGGWGGGLCDYYSDSSVLTGCYFEGNTATYGGGVFRSYGVMELTGCTFLGNIAEIAGGGAAFSSMGPGTHPVLTGCTFSRNGAPEGGGIQVGNGSVTLANTIIAFGTEGEGVRAWPSSMSCTDIYGNAGGDWVAGLADWLGTDGNICADPLFCGDEYPDKPLALHADSPCAPASSPSCGLIGGWDVGCQATAVEQTSWGSIKAMFR